MKPLFVNPKDFEPSEMGWRPGTKTDEELQIIRQSIISGAYIVHPDDIADAMLAEAWLEVVQPTSGN